MIHFIVFLITGLIAGLIAEKILKQPHGWFVSMIIGVIGAWIGGFLSGLLHIPAVGTGIAHWIFQVFVAVVGAVVLLWVLSLFRKRTA